MTKKILLLGSGELGKEFVIAAQRLGQTVVACDRYAGAPAMQVADASEVFDMLDGDALAAVVERHRPDIIVPEIEAIRTERLYDFERRGVQVVPSARAVNFTMNRKAIRDLAAKELGPKTARYFYAKSLDELTLAYATTIHKAQGSEYPIVVMPVLMTHFVMLQRNLIYTGITRAKKICVLIGATKALAYAVHNMSVLKRNTSLRERLNPSLTTDGKLRG